MGVLFSCTMCMQAQQQSATSQGTHLEVGVSYQAFDANPVQENYRFWMQGGGLQVHDQFKGKLGVVADLSGQHVGNIHSTGIGLDLITATFGPRYTQQLLHGRLSAYGQALYGEAWGMHSIFSDGSSTTDHAVSQAWTLGGGVNLRLHPHLQVQVVEADWVRTQLPNAASNVQNNLRLGTGIVWRFK
jgi:hypothetical protein